MFIFDRMNGAKRKGFQDKLELILAMYNTHTYEEIGKKIGVSRQRVCQLVQQMKDKGVKLPDKRSPKFDWELFAKKHAEKE